MVTGRHSLMEAARKPVETELSLEPGSATIHHRPMEVWSVRALLVKLYHVRVFPLVMVNSNAYNTSQNIEVLVADGILVEFYHKHWWLGWK